jgi:Uma2 family endonuclease
MSTVSAKLMTAEDLLRLPRGMGERHELVKGELITMAPAGFEHGRIANRLQMHLNQYVYVNKLGEVFTAETEFIIRRDPDTVRAPDTGFVSNDRLDQHGRSVQGYYPIAPDLAVEVVSPSDRQDEIDTKIEEWFEGGARAVWVVSPRRKTVTVYNSPTDIKRLTITDTLSGDSVLPGFACPLTDIFPAESK